MPHQRDDSDSTSTLPHPEVNPLINPLLAQNMGRWAEVYFTSPPENREQAVLNLLHELEAQSPLQGGAASTERPSHGEPAAPQQALPTARINRESKLVGCLSCGRKNPEGYEFCGMCGALLGEQGTHADSHIGDSSHAQSGLRQMQVESAAVPLKPFVKLPAFASVQSSSVENGQDVDSFVDSYRGSNDFKLFADYKPVSYRFRVYAGAVLAIMIVVLGYMAWRSTQASSQSIPSSPPALREAWSQPPTQTQPAMQTQQPATPAQRAVESEPRSGTAATNTPPSASSTQVEEPAHSTPAGAGPELSQASQPAGGLEQSTSEKNPQARASEASGSEELSIAESYLNGAAGKGRDGGEAVKWLWKSVGKHNAAATLLLSDLYLKGDQVPKNCDQARLLLDAAARKGIAGAGERLRNLQAFGCQ